MIGADEIKATQGLLSFFSEHPVVIDCGSNKGAWADIILDEFGDNCTIHLFEPNQLLLDYTRIKYEYRKNIEYSRYAISNRENGNQEFFYFENYNNELSSLFDGGAEWEGLPKMKKIIEATTLEYVAKVKKFDFIDCIKLDIEGSERDAVLGAEPLLKEGKIGFIILEYGAHYKRAKATFKEIIELVNKYDYKVYSFDGENYNEVEAEAFEEDYHAENYIITNRDIHFYTLGGWAGEFKKNTEGLKFDFALEIGTYEGNTAKYICDNLLNKDGRIIVVDPLLDFYCEEDNNKHKYFRDQYQRFKSNTRGYPIELKRGNAEVELPKLKDLRFDFVYVDSNHFAPHPYNDGSWAFALTKEGGIILFDDYLWRDETKESIDLFLKEFKGYYEMVVEGYQVMIKKTMNYYNELTKPYYQ